MEAQISPVASFHPTDHVSLCPPTRFLSLSASSITATPNAKPTHGEERCGFQPLPSLFRLLLPVSPLSPALVWVIRRLLGAQGVAGCVGLLLQSPALSIGFGHLFHLISASILIYQISFSFPNERNKKSRLWTESTIKLAPWSSAELAIWSSVCVMLG